MEHATRYPSDLFVPLWVLTIFLVVGYTAGAWKLKHVKPWVSALQVLTAAATLFNAWALNERDTRIDKVLGSWDPQVPHLSGWTVALSAVMVVVPLVMSIREVLSNDASHAGDRDLMRLSGRFAMTGAALTLLAQSGLSNSPHDTWRIVGAATQLFFIGCGLTFAFAFGLVVRGMWRRSKRKSASNTRHLHVVR